MRSMTLALAWLLLPQTPWAQPISLLPPGTQVRLSIRGTDASNNPLYERIAHVIAARSESLDVRLADRDSVSVFAWSDVTRLEVSRDVPLNERVEGGAIVGGIIGAVAGAIGGSRKESEGWDLFDPTVVGAAEGAAVGILAGGMIGAVTSTKRWEQIWPARGTREERSRKSPPFFGVTPRFGATPGFGGTPRFARP